MKLHPDTTVKINANREPTPLSNLEAHIQAQLGTKPLVYLLAGPDDDDTGTIYIIIRAPSDREQAKIHYQYIHRHSADIQQFLKSQGVQIHSPPIIESDYNPRSERYNPHGYSTRMRLKATLPHILSDTR